MNNKKIEKKQKKRFINTEFEQEIPFSNRILIYAIIAFVISFVFWANEATLDEVARGQGQVVPSSEIQIVESLEAGLIEDILVGEGDMVKAGQIVLRLKNTQARADLESKLSKFYSLRARAERLKAEAAGAEELEFSEQLIANAPKSVNEELQAFLANQKNIETQLDIFDRQIRQKQQEVSETRSRIRDIESVMDVSQDEYDILSQLVERGSASKVELMQLDRSLKEQKAELNALRLSLPRLNEAVQEIRARKEDVISEAKAKAQQERAVTMQEVSSLQKTIEGLEDRQVRTELRSPVSGVIKDVLVSSVGEVVKPGEELLQIVPEDDQLLIETRIRPSDIAFLRPGQRAVVQVTAYDFSIYGGLIGEVVGISADTITDQEGQTFYRVKIKTSESKIRQKGEVLPIIPGMIATVDIVTGERTVMQYIMNPILRTMNTAFREQ